MTGYNRIIMVGNLTRDPDLRPVGSANVCKLNIASNRQYKNKQTGALIQEVCFIDIEVWGAQADTCKLYLQKGRPVLVEGRLKLDSWKDADGQTKSKHSIVSEKIIFLGTSDNQGTHQDEHSIQEDNDSLHNSTVRAAAFDSAKKSTRMKDKPTGSITFQDSPPFAIEDDLPF